MCCDVSWSCKASKENKQRARMVVKVRVQVIIGWVCGIGECAGISLSEIRLANMCVDMSLPMHFNKFMVAIKQIVTTFFVCVRCFRHVSVFDSQLCRNMCRVHQKKWIFVAYARCWFISQWQNALILLSVFPIFFARVRLTDITQKNIQIAIKNRLPYGFYTHFPVVS